MCQVIDNFIQEGWDKARREYEPLLAETKRALEEKERENAELRRRLSLLEQG